MRKLLSVFICLGLVLAFSAYAVAAPKITATLKAVPDVYRGKCPTIIQFKGAITVSEPGRVQYKFIRSDGASAPVQTLVFDAAGTKPVTDEWHVGRTYTGWEAIEVIYPQPVTSNHADFRIVCAEVGQQKITATLRAIPATYTGKCPRTIRFAGNISVTEPAKVQYRFIRSDGASAPVQTLVFSAPGTKAVGTAWQLGKDYDGWEAIEVLYPQPVTSNHADFKLRCMGPVVPGLVTK